MNCQNFLRGGSAPAPPEMYNVIHSELHSQARLGRARNLGQRFDPKTGVVPVLAGSAESLQMAPARRGSRECERGRRHTRRSRGPLRGYTEVACERVAVIQMGRQMEGGLGRQMEKQKRRPRLAQLRGVAALRASPRGARRKDPARLARARLTRTRFGRVASTSASSAAATVSAFLLTTIACFKAVMAGS